MIEFTNQHVLAIGPTMTFVVENEDRCEVSPMLVKCLSIKISKFTISISCHTVNYVDRE